VRFAYGRSRSDMVAILAVLARSLSGVPTIQESLTGFGKPMVMLIVAAAIIGEGLVAAGVAYRLDGSSEARLVALVQTIR
jgi:hypothetical protein